MPKNFELLLADPTSYVSDGDVLPFADIETQVEPIKNTNYAAKPDNLDGQEAAEAALHAKALAWPVVEIPSEDPTVEHSENYQKVKQLIDEGIAASKAAQLPQLMVNVWLKATHLRTAKEVEMTLSQYLGGGSLNGLVSTREYNALVAEYISIDTAYTALHAGEISQSDENEPTIKPQAQALGGIAAGSLKPKSRYKSGGKDFIDRQSAAANDNTLHED